MGTHVAVGKNSQSHLVTTSRHFSPKMAGYLALGVIPLLFAIFVLEVNQVGNQIQNHTMSGDKQNVRFIKSAAQMASLCSLITSLVLSQIVHSEKLRFLNFYQKEGNRRRLGFVGFVSQGLVSLG